MGSLITKALKWVASQLDKWIPGTGARTITVAILLVIGHLSLFLTGTETVEVAVAGIITGLGLIFASVHK